MANKNDLGPLARGRELPYCGALKMPHDALEQDTRKPGRQDARVGAERVGKRSWDLGAGTAAATINLLPLVLVLHFLFACFSRRLA